MGRSEVEITIPKAVMPKEGYKTSSFALALAVWVVGGLVTFLTTRYRMAVPDTIREELIAVIADALPIAWLAVSGWVTSQYIKARGKVSEQKAEAVRMIVTSQLENK